MNRHLRARLSISPMVLGLLVLAPLRGEVIVLSSGSQIEGGVVKRTPETVFVDVGYTILAIPAKEVKEVRAPATPAGAAGRATPGTEDARSAPTPAAAGPREQGEGIFSSTSDLAPGSVKDKAREVAEGVVQVVCPAKLGSGFIINDQGYVMTNCHVVEEDQDIAVIIYVKDEHDFRKVRMDRVRIVALNPFFDLALLKIEEDPEKGKEMPRFKKVFLGDSESVRVGDPVFAVGSPLGLERTVTEGIVSNSRRARGGLMYLQTSAPINPGNSGGPLFNDRGEVVGITSLKVMFGESLGFAIPVNYVKDFLRNREAFAFDKDHANNGVRYLPPPRKKAPENRKL
jgi:serine protease Do